MLIRDKPLWRGSATNVCFIHFEKALLSTRNEQHDTADFAFGIRVYRGNFDDRFGRGNRSKLELYNLSTDLIEATNIADEHPDVVEKMKRIAAEAHTATRLGTFSRTDLNDKDGLAAGEKPNRIRNQ